MGTAWSSEADSLVRADGSGLVGRPTLVMVSCVSATACVIRMEF